MRVNAPERQDPVSGRTSVGGDLMEEGGEAIASPPISRMAIALFSLLGLLVAGYMLLYKLGMIGTLVCGSGSCGTVQASKWADFLGVPVPAWGVVGYATILGVSLAGIQPRWIGDRRLGLVLFGLAAIAFVFSAYLTAIEAFVLYAWCRWCVVSAILATLIFILSFAELRRKGENG